MRRGFVDAFLVLKKKLEPYRTVNLLLDNMKVFLLVVCLAVCGLAQRPQPCDSPPLLSGSLTVITQSESLVAFVNYTYDGIQERIRLQEFGLSGNETFLFDFLLLYKQRIMYQINNENQTCFKKRLGTSFYSLSVPKNASFQGHAVLGSSSFPGEGVQINTWEGEVHTKDGIAKYIKTVTQTGCIPITTLYLTPQDEWVVTSFYDNIVGIPNLQNFEPPKFCENAQLEEEEEPEYFYMFI
ncbi:ependymin-2 [Austrofundulus limnaeus]|uniref:Ependymin-2 n=1 Tax=Austrofundulus limnaeus TaxID=52670 RepID=A0A2I4C7L3_AUSLI|nr:PREDICTED: ependymin-2-like [Austrofundulus limnaeus]